MFDVYVCTCCDCDCHWAAAAAAAISLLTSERVVHSSMPSVHTLVVSDTLCSNRARSTGASKVSRGRGARHHRSGDSQSWRVMGGSKAAHPCIEQCHQLRRADLVGGLCSRPRREEPSPPPTGKHAPRPRGEDGVAFPHKNIGRVRSRSSATSYIRVLQLGALPPTAKRCLHSPKACHSSMPSAQTCKAASVGGQFRGPAADTQPRATARHSAPWSCRQSSPT
jgi:hypothetical protein